MSFIAEKTQECSIKVASFVSPIIFIISTIVDMTTIAEKYSAIIKPVMFISALTVIGLSFYYAWFIKQSAQIRNELDKQQQKITLLEQEICAGNQLTKSEAIVTFLFKPNKYLLEITKEYRIISDRIKWFECQFYCNNQLIDAKAAQAGYQENQVSWEELNVKASLSFKNQGEDEFCAPVDVMVKRVAEGNNYKRFHILYQSSSGDSLDIRKGTMIRLEYKYNIPVDKWGSYLNRYVTYWGEETKVTVACPKKDTLKKTELKVYRTNTDGKPVLYQEANWKESKVGDKYAREVVLKPIQYTKYLVWWDANEVFKGEKKDLNTIVGVDELQLTQY